MSEQDNSGDNPFKQEKKCPYTQKQINEMKQKGLSKPDDCPVADWQAPLTLKNHHYAIAYMHVMGSKTNEIAEQLHLEKNSVTKILNTDRMRELCAKIRYKYFVVDAKKRFDQILPKAIDTAEKIMVDKKVKPSTRLIASGMFMDRALGKAVQQFEVGGNIVKQLLDRLTEKEVEPVPKAIDMKPVTKDPIEAEYSEVKEDDDSSDIDEWISKNLT